jgi:hypothetical protein
MAPAFLTLAAFVAAITVSWWWLAAIPFIWLGSICAQPNLNLADGCLTYLSVGAALVVLRFHPPLGQAILSGAVAGYVFAFAEKMIRMRPITEADDSGRLSTDEGEQGTAGNPGPPSA